MHSVRRFVSTYHVAGNGTRTLKPWTRTAAAGACSWLIQAWSLPHPLYQYAPLQRRIASWVQRPSFSAWNQALIFTLACSRPLPHHLWRSSLWPRKSRSQRPYLLGGFASICEFRSAEFLQRWFQSMGWRSIEKSPRNMSPKEPPPIFFDKRYFFPTRSSILLSTPGAGRASLFYWRAPSIHELPVFA